MSVWPFLGRRSKLFDELYAVIMMSHDGFLRLCFLQLAAIKKTNKKKPVLRATVNSFHQKAYKSPRLLAIAKEREKESWLQVETISFVSQPWLIS